MRLDTAREETITNLSGSRKFGMNASAKAFQILSSGIYERKIEAIVRELSCNAYDSHVQAGKADEPFRIQMPTVMNDFVFAVEDFGVGLSEEEVYNVYTTYFESTKTDSNDVIGALGLGSKSPFSYTDSFTIKARKDGKECVFSAQISASGEPEVIKMYERPWAGSNGVEVSVEVAQKDVREFYDCAEKVLGWFVVKPLCNKELSYQVDQEVVDNVRQYGYHLKQGSTWSRTSCKVLMGNVAYSLDLSDLKEDDEEFNGFVSNLDSMKADVYFEVAIGDADVAANRETLSLDDRTKLNLRTKLKEIQKNFKETTIKKMEKFGNIIEATREMTSYEKTIAKDVPVNGYCFKNMPSKFRTYVRAERDDNGNVVDAAEKAFEDTCDQYDIAFYGSFNKRWGSNARSKRDTICHWTSLVGSNNYVTVVINDCERKTGLKDALANANLPEYVMVVTDKKTTLTADLEALIGRLTCNAYKIVYASSFWDGKLAAKKSSSGGLAAEVIKGVVVERTVRHPMTKKVDFSVENPQNWAYIDGTGNKSIFTSSEFNVMDYRDLANLVVELDLDGIFIYNGNNGAKVKRNIPNNLYDLIRKNASQASAVKSAIRSELRSHLNEPVTMLRGFKDLVSFAEAKSNDYPVCSSMMRFDAINEREIMRATERRVKVMEESINALRNRSPVLNKLLTWRFFDSSMEHEINEYIDFLNNRKER